MKKTFFVMLTLFMPFSSFGNDAFIGESGRAVSLIKTHEIRMVREHIKIRGKDMDTNWTYPERFADVECVFYFENLTDHDIEATVGFPGDENFMEDEEPKLLGKFKVLVNGKTMFVKSRPEVIKPFKTYSYNEKDKPGLADHGSYVKRYWYTWKMVFPPKKIVKVENFYTAPFSSASGFDPLSFTYILKTAQSWSSPIENAVIEVIYKNKEDFKKRFLGASPSGYAIRDNVIIWNFSNFTPDEDVVFFEQNLFLKK